jgi:NTE family protein
LKGRIAVISGFSARAIFASQQFTLYIAAMHKPHRLGQAIRAIVSPVLKQIGVPPAGPEPAIDRAAPRRSTARRLRVSLALQGGGSLGAFTWGVLDRLLEEKDLSIDAVSGASAGAVNAVVMSDGFAKSGAAGAREALAKFWKEASDAAPRHGGGRVPSSLAFDLSTRLMSPYQFNPLDINPLRSLLGETDFETLRETKPLRLLIGATRVSDGRLRIFREGEITRDVVLASACLPMLQHAVTIDGEAYWDGGYAANPPLMPLVTASRAADILVVQIIPTEGEEMPRTSPEIIKRLNQMTFNSSLLRDLDTLSSMTELAKEREGEGRLSRKLRRLRVHRLAAENTVPNLRELSAFDLDWDVLTQLRDSGRDAADAWLKERSAEAVATPPPAPAS